MSLLLPPGTRVVARHAVRVAETDALLPAGAVGVILHAEDDRTYRVRFPDESQASLRREELSILKSMKERGLRQVPHDVDWADQ